MSFSEAAALVPLVAVTLFSFGAVVVECGRQVRTHQAERREHVTHVAEVRRHGQPAGLSVAREFVADAGHMTRKAPRPPAFATSRRSVP